MALANVKQLLVRQQRSLKSLSSCINLNRNFSSCCCCNDDEERGNRKTSPIRSCISGTPDINFTVSSRHLSISSKAFNTSNSNSKWEFFNNPPPSDNLGEGKRIIQDVIEEQWNPQPEEYMPESPAKEYNLERGKTGVFDLDELIELIKEHNGQDICVIAIPKELDYADHMVIVTTRTSKHMFALATFIRKRFKCKHLLKTDIIPKIEGTKSNDDWLALDMINIVLHIFCKESREYFDLETLWTVGSNFDDLTHKKDSEIIQLLNLFK